MVPAVRVEFGGAARPLARQLEVGCVVLDPSTAPAPFALRLRSAPLLPSPNLTQTLQVKAAPSCQVSESELGMETEVAGSSLAPGPMSDPDVGTALFSALLP